MVDIPTPVWGGNCVITIDDVALQCFPSGQPIVYRYSPLEMDARWVVHAIPTNRSLLDVFGSSRQYTTFASLYLDDIYVFVFTCSMITSPDAFWSHDLPLMGWNASNSQANSWSFTGLLRSSDHGLSWASVTADLRIPRFLSLGSLAVDRQTGVVVYSAAEIGTSLASTRTSVYRMDLSATTKVFRSIHLPTSLTNCDFSMVWVGVKGVFWMIGGRMNGGKDVTQLTFDDQSDTLQVYTRSATTRLAIAGQAVRYKSTVFVIGGCVSFDESSGFPIGQDHRVIALQAFLMDASAAGTVQVNHVSDRPVSMFNASVILPSVVGLRGLLYIFGGRGTDHMTGKGAPDRESWNIVDVSDHEIAGRSLIITHSTASDSSLRIIRIESNPQGGHISNLSLGGISVQPHAYNLSFALNDQQNAIESQGFDPTTPYVIVTINEGAFHLEGVPCSPLKNFVLHLSDAPEATGTQYLTQLLVQSNPAAANLWTSLPDSRRFEPLSNNTVVPFKLRRVIDGTAPMQIGQPSHTMYASASGAAPSTRFAIMTESNRVILWVNVRADLIGGRLIPVDQAAMHEVQYRLHNKGHEYSTPAKILFTADGVLDQAIAIQGPELMHVRPVTGALGFAPYFVLPDLQDEQIYDIRVASRTRNETTTVLSEVQVMIKSREIAPVIRRVTRMPNDTYIIIFTTPGDVNYNTIRVFDEFTGAFQDVSVISSSISTNVSASLPMTTFVTVPRICLFGFNSFDGNIVAHALAEPCSASPSTNISESKDLYVINGINSPAFMVYGGNAVVAIDDIEIDAPYMLMCFPNSMPLYNYGDTPKVYRVFMDTDVTTSSQTDSTRIASSFVWEDIDAHFYTTNEQGEIFNFDVMFYEELINRGNVDFSLPADDEDEEEYDIPPEDEEENNVSGVYWTTHTGRFKEYVYAFMFSLGKNDVAGLESYSDIYVTGSGQNPNINRWSFYRAFRSNDDGYTWFTVDIKHPELLDDHMIGALAVNPRTGMTCFATSKAMFPSADLSPRLFAVDLSASQPVWTALVLPSDFASGGEYSIVCTERQLISEFVLLGGRANHGRNYYTFQIAPNLSMQSFTLKTNTQQISYGRGGQAVMFAGLIFTTLGYAALDSDIHHPNSPNLHCQVFQLNDVASKPDLELIARNVVQFPSRYYNDNLGSAALLYPSCCVVRNRLYVFGGKSEGTSLVPAPARPVGIEFKKAFFLNLQLMYTDLVPTPTGTLRQFPDRVQVSYEFDLVQIAVQSLTIEFSVNGGATWQKPTNFTFSLPRGVFDITTSDGVTPFQTLIIQIRGATIDGVTSYVESLGSVWFGPLLEIERFEAGIQKYTMVFKGGEEHGKQNAILQYAYLNIDAETSFSDFKNADALDIADIDTNAAYYVKLRQIEVSEDVVAVGPVSRAYATNNPQLYFAGDVFRDVTKSLTLETFVSARSSLPFVDISTKKQHVLAIKSDGTLWAMGRNDAGQLGNGNRTDTAELVQIGIASNWSRVHAGGSFSLALTTDGHLYQWGYQIGSNPFIDDSSNFMLKPTRVSTKSNWKSISAGDEHALAIDEDGKLFGWGSFGSGHVIFVQRVMFSRTITPQELQVNPNPASSTGSQRWALIAAGHEYSLAMRENGDLFANGSNQFGVFGNNTTSTNLGVDDRFYRVSSGTTWTQLAATLTHVLAVRSDKTVWAWGQNIKRQLGTASSNSSRVPVQVTLPGIDPLSIESVVVAAGYTHSFALVNNDRLFAWGSNGLNREAGLFDTGIDVLINNIPTPREVNAGSWRGVTAGDRFSIFLNNNSVST